ncbi:unnamed protein product [Oikopleura dioica]|uniref:Uncharacterized protein n=1 Tax=Oikopleura dioica TaxID=34765 RepID=E4XBK4_OIKDI|nr:unnamed protein product [Oikopleura dioica]
MGAFLSILGSVWARVHTSAAARYSDWSGFLLLRTAISLSQTIRD